MRDCGFAYIPGAENPFIVQSPTPPPLGLSTDLQQLGLLVTHTRAGPSTASGTPTVQLACDGCSPCNVTQTNSADTASQFHTHEPDGHTCMG